MGFVEFCSAYLVDILLFVASVFTGIYAGLAINEIRKKIKAKKETAKKDKDTYDGGAGCGN